MKASVYILAGYGVLCAIKEALWIAYTVKEDLDVGIWKETVKYNLEGLKKREA